MSHISGLGKPRPASLGVDRQPVVVEYNLVATVLHRAVGGLGEPNDVARQRQTVLRELSGADRVDERTGLQSERLRGGEVGRSDVSAAIGELPFAERLRILVLHSTVVDLDRLGRS